MTERAQIITIFIVLLFVAGVIATAIARAPDTGDTEIRVCTATEQDQILEAWRDRSPLDLPNCVPTQDEEMDA